MNDHSKDSQTRYLKETAIVLAREGFQTDRTHTDGLRVQLDGVPLCEVTDNGGITYRNEDINEPERINAKDKVLADFNGTVLRANTESTSSHGIGSMGTQAYRHQQSADRKCSLLCLWPFGPAKNSEPEEAIPRN